MALSAVLGKLLSLGLNAKKSSAPQRRVRFLLGRCGTGYRICRCHSDQSEGPPAAPLQKAAKFRLHRLVGNAKHSIQGLAQLPLAPSSLFQLGKGRPENGNCFPPGGRVGGGTRFREA